MKAAKVIVADPPWHFSDALPGKGRGAIKHYPTMSEDALKAWFPKLEVSPDAVLFMWRVAAMADEAWALCHAWGFQPKSEIVWLKRTIGGRRHFGMGRYVRMEHENCIIATRGRAFPRAHNVRSTFEAPIGRHSQKPEEFFDLVETMYKGPYVELFARRQRQGWLCLGNEMPKDRSHHSGDTASARTRHHCR
jgi:N6-adenosine-specific RNA methylase IME4